MAKRLFIKDTATGEIRPSKWQDTSSRFWWEEGNASCDCNRAIAFSNDQEYDQLPCGDARFELVNEDGTPFTDWPPEDL